MHELGGNIACNSVFGEYTEFTLTFPVLDQKQILDAKKELSLRKNTELSKFIKILLIKPQDYSDDIKILVQAEKSLKMQVKKLMTDNGLDVINLKKGKISVKKSSRKQGLNKTSVKEGLTTYFNGNEDQAESCLKVILDNLPTKESTALSLTGLKDKKQE